MTTANKFFAIAAAVVVFAPVAAALLIQAARIVA
jgi:hypothetical protein